MMTKNQSTKNLSKFRYVRPQTSKVDNRIRKELTEEKKQVDYSALIATPSGQEVSINITDHDSKQFFDEVFDDPQDLDSMLLDMPLITEAKMNDEEPHEEDNEFDIKREIQTMKEGDMKKLLVNNVRYNPSDDEEGLCDVGDESNSGDHSSVPKPSMKARTIRDINSQNGTNR